MNLFIKFMGITFTVDEKLTWTYKMGQRRALPLTL